MPQTIRYQGDTYIIQKLKPLNYLGERGFFVVGIKAPPKPLKVSFKELGADKRKSAVRCLNNGKTYESVAIAARALDLHRTTISKVLAGTLKSNWRFVYVETP